MVKEIRQYFEGKEPHLKGYPAVIGSSGSQKFSTVDSKVPGEGNRKALRKVLSNLR